jgi:HlyD family secretion protein
VHSSAAEATTDSETSCDRTGTEPGNIARKDPRILFRPRGWIGPVMAVAILLVIFLVILASLRGKASPSWVVAPPSDRATRSHTLRLKGATEAVQARAILAPLLAGAQVSTLTVTKLSPTGRHVKPGDLLVEFDRQSQMRDFIDKQADYNKLVDQVLEQQAKEDAARAKDETEIKQAEDTFSKAQLEMQKIEIFSRIDTEKAQENFDEAKATLEQLRETFDLKRKAARAAIRVLEIQRDRTHETMLHAQVNAELMQIHAPLGGIVVLNTIWKQGKIGEVQEGDQIRAGVAFMQVVDPSVMQVRVPVNQEDLLGLQIGQTANVYLDAYPELMFPGRLEEMAPIGRSGDFSSRLRSFAVIFSIKGSDPRLMPDLSAAVDVDLKRASGAGGSQ